MQTKIPKLIHTLLTFSGVLALLSGCQDDGNDKLFNATYVGKEICVTCHERESALFMNSDHDLAMADANETTVLGDFGDVDFTYFGVTSKFFKKDGKFYVHTEGPGGKFSDYEVAYTFGARPLQQYLAEFPGGRLQCLPFAWDTRPLEQGGQRWFHLYHDERIAANDILYWTSATQNWNHMCAECHSTNLQKNYNSETGTYKTTWSEIDVSCEACHGPGSRHAAWAENAQEISRPTVHKGLLFDMEKTGERPWVMNPETGNATLALPDTMAAQVDMCGRCHSHRTAISENYVHGKPLCNSHLISLLEENLYFPDGQIKEEVYVYGSFLQSKMYQAGVICTDCHDPHSTRTILAGDALCLRCHSPEKYDSRDHHFHRTEAVQCVDCHMPDRTYMVIDDRRDHSFRVPRPDLSVKLETPNACNHCHADKAPEWTARYFRKWYPQRSARQHYGEILYAGQKSDPGFLSRLLELAGDQTTPAIVRATAAVLLARYPGLRAPAKITQLAGNSDPLIRNAAIAALVSVNSRQGLALLNGLLGDSSRAVRAEAARALVSASNPNPGVLNEQAFSTALKEYEEIQKINEDFPAAGLNLASLYLEKGDRKKSEAQLLKVIAMEPAFLPAYINLADLYRQEQQELKAEEVLLQGLSKDNDDPALHHALGLLRIRTGEKEKAMQHLKFAAEHAAANAHYNYVYAVALNSFGKTKAAVSVLENALVHDPFDPELLQAAAAICRDAGDTKKAEQFAQRLAGVMAGAR